MELLPIIYLFYMFIAIYFLSFFLILYFRNKNDMFLYPKTDKKYSISVLVPSFNEEKTIAETVNSIFESEYPINEVIVLNDGSTDNTKKIVEKLIKKYPNLILLNKQNSGKADSLNQGLKISKSDLVAVVDADSYPAKDSFKKLIGYFDDKEVGAVTCIIVPRNKKGFIQTLQTIEYNAIAFTRKLLDYVDGIYVTPGPLTLYRKKALEEISGFDKNSLTEDIEATWHLTYSGYKRKMCLATNVTTTVPEKFKIWYKQRRRWSTGGLQCIAKYKKFFLKRGMLGMFILPFFILQLFNGLLGLSVFTYLITTRTIRSYLFTKYSIDIGTQLVTINNLYITPTFLNYLGVILFIVGGIFTLLSLYVMKEKALVKQNGFTIFFYLIFYLSIYPFIMITAIYNYFKGTKKWR